MDLKIIEAVECPEEEDIVKVETCRRCGFFQKIIRLSKGFSEPDWAVVCDYKETKNEREATLTGPLSTLRKT